MNDTRDVMLVIDNVPPESLTRVWQGLSLVAQGHAEDGHAVSLRTYRDEDEDEAEMADVYGPSEESR